MPARTSLLTRRTFACTFAAGSVSALAAAELGCAAGRRDATAASPGKLHDRRIDEVIARALEAAKRGGATYADVRIVRRRTEVVRTREDHVIQVSAGETYGLGVRVIVDGAWGFASTARVEGEAAEASAASAVMTARASKVAMKRPVTLAPAPVVTGTWRSPMQIDPFEVPLADKAQLLLDLWPRARGVRLVKYADAAFEALGEHKIFASSEGSRIEQSITRVWPSFSVTAVQEGQFESRASEIPPRQAGWEYVTSAGLAEGVRRIAEDAVEKLRSPSVTAGKKDLVLAPSNLWLTIHESVGHPTELDRALGLEANFAGTSFATTDKLGKLTYGSEAVTLYADKTTPGGLATCEWDDDGVKSQRWNLVEKGRFVGYQTTRDQAAWIGERASRGTAYAEDHKAVAFQRMPNVSLAADEKSRRTLADLIAATDDGVLVSGNGSWSIDHQRYNFQFSGQMFHAIKGGKLAGTLRDVAYQSNSLEFWRSCDMVGGPESWELHGTLWDGKGEPMQTNAVSHGCPPARFRGVDILNVNAREGA